MVDNKTTWLEDDDVIQAPDILAQLQALEQSPGWKLISNILDKQVQMRLNAIVSQPLKSLDAALEQEYAKGEAEQLITLRGLPTVLIEELQQTVQEMQASARRADDDSPSEPDAS